jgi:hypothetical protein
LQHPVQFVRAAWLGDKVGRAERAGAAGVAGVILSRQNHDLDTRREIQQVGNQPEPLVRTMRERWQSQVDQCEFGQPAELPEELRAVWPRVTGDDLEGCAHRETQSVGDERIVIDDEQQRLLLQSGFRCVGHGSWSLRFRSDFYDFHYSTIV